MELATPEWKWLLQQMGDGELMRVARQLRLRLGGQHPQRWERQWPAARPEVEQALLRSKRLPRLRRALNVRVRREQQLVGLRRRSESELQADLLAGLPPGQLMLALLSSPETSQQAKARRLFDFLRKSGSLSQWLQADQRPPAAPDGRQSELDAARDAWEQERQALTKQVDALQTELAELRQTQSRSQRQWETERQMLLSRLADRDTRLQQRSQQLQAMQRQVTAPDDANDADGNSMGEAAGQSGSEQGDMPAPVGRADALVASDDGSQQGGKTEPFPAEAPRPTVVLVGGISLSAMELPSRRQIVSVTPREVHLEPAKAALQQAVEIWLLTYATPLPIQRHLRQVATERLRAFSSYEELLTFIEQEEGGR